MNLARIIGGMKDEGFRVLSNSENTIFVFSLSVISFTNKLCP